MGACYGTDMYTRQIEMKLIEASTFDEGCRKILFLGPGGSGKSTIFKQLQWLHLDGFTERDAKNLKRHIFAQTVQQMKVAVMFHESQDERTSVEDDSKLEDAKSIVKGYKDQCQTWIDAEMADATQYIWQNDDQIKNIFDHLEHDVFKMQLIDETTQYFWDNIDRLKQPDYIPNDDDILHVRSRTTGVADKLFRVKATNFHIFDVGGQKSERRKWIHFFNEVDAVLFVISLACYDQLMYQDTSTNCMTDSLELFEDIANNPHFDDTHMILFLNKKDLFEKKIRKVPITACPDFDDFNEFDHGSEAPNPNDFEQTTAFIKHKFKALRHKKDKQIYAHLTYAMDRKNIDRVFVDVDRIIFTANFSANSISMA
eukprot:313837_1